LACQQRIIVLATNSASTILADSVTTATKIFEKAKQGASELTKQLLADLRDEITNLSELGLKKLKSELNVIFDDLIAKAKATGDSVLADTLTRSRDDTLSFIQNELFRRFGFGSGTSTGTSTSTSTGTSTATSTGSATSSSTNTNTATNTTSGTATASSTVVFTSSSTSTSTMTAIKARDSSGFQRR
jgi:vacuolar-type H+-ATPase subunit H